MATMTCCPPGVMLAQVAIGLAAMAVGAFFLAGGRVRRPSDAEIAQRLASMREFGFRFSANGDSVDIHDGSLRFKETRRGPLSDPLLDALEFAEARAARSRRLGAQQAEIEKALVHATSGPDCKACDAAAEFHRQCLMCGRVDMCSDCIEVYLGTEFNCEARRRKADKARARR